MLLQEILSRENKPEGGREEGEGGKAGGREGKEEREGKTKKGRKKKREDFLYSKSYNFLDTVRTSFLSRSYCSLHSTPSHPPHFQLPTVRQ